MDIVNQWWVIAGTAYAMVLGGAVGYERELKDRPAGFRTHMLVAGAATLLIEIGELLMFDARYRGSQFIQIDPLRLVEAVVSGVAFIGAGTIFAARFEQRRRRHHDRSFAADGCDRRRRGRFRLLSAVARDHAAHAVCARGAELWRAQETGEQENVGCNLGGFGELQHRLRIGRGSRLVQEVGVHGFPARRAAAFHPMGEIAARIFFQT